MRRVSIACLLAAACFGTARAAETAAFLKISPGARPTGMGEAHTAVADDLNALLWNPAGLAHIVRGEAAFMHAELFAHTRYDFLGYAHPLGGGLAPSLPQGTLGLGVARLSQAPLEGRDENRRPTGSFDASDTAVHLAYSRRFLGRGPMFGVAGKYIESSLAEARARSFAVDIGAMGFLQGGRSPLSLGASVLNLGPGMRFSRRTDELPLTVSLGAGLRILPALLLAADWRYRPRSGLSVFSLGTEYVLFSALSVRGGYQAQSTAPAASVRGGGFLPQGLSSGFGLKLGKAGVDYSFTPAGELGGVQRISFSTRF